MNQRICAPRISFAMPTSACLLVVVILSCSQTSSAQRNSQSAESPAAARVRALNNSLLRLHGQMQQAGPNNVALMRSQAASVLAQRAAALTYLISTDPRAGLSLAFPPELLADLAAKFPQSASSLESHATISGAVTRWIADYPGTIGAHSWLTMKQGQTVLSLHFACPEPPNFKSGDVLQITGVVAGSQMAVETTKTAQVSSAGLPTNADHPSTGKRLPGSPTWQTMGVLTFGFVFSLAGLSRKSRTNRIRALSFLKHLAIYGLATALLISSPPASFAQNSCTTKGVQNTVVLMVNLPNGSLPAGVTPASLQDVFFASNTAGDSVDGFLREASYGQTFATGDVFGPYNLTGTYTSCSDVSGTVLNDAIAAATASGVNLNNYTRLFLVFPDVFGCGWQGFAAVGTCSQTTPSGTFNLSVSYLSAAYTTPRSAGVQLASHELGHNFGLLHGGTLTPGTVSDVIGPLTSPGTEADLGDYWSTMGEAVLGLYPASQKINTLGWMNNPANYQAVTSSGTYTIQPLETSPAGLEVLKIQRGSGNPGYYLWVEYRQPVGAYDSTLMCDYCRGGTSDFSAALIHYQDPNTNPAHSYLPNFTPSDPSWNSPALAAGQTWADPYSNLSLSVTSTTPTALTLNVNYGAVPCTQSNPTVSLSPPDPSIYPGNSTTYTVSVTDNDSSGCSASTYTLSSSQPAGWSTSFSTSSVTLNPGQSASPTMNKTAPSVTQPGTFAVDASAANNSYVGTGTANVTVVAAPSVTVTASVPSSSYTRRSTVPIAATVLNGGTPASGASVTFTLTRADGSVVTQSATTNSKGTATWNYKLNPKSPTGMYSAIAQAVLNSTGAAGVQPVTSSPVSFAVQ
jgi:M6 family metalloprotease-like protein